MAIYKTYQEAVIANGETQGVCTTGDDRAGSERYRGYFTIMDAHETIDVSAGAWIECNPADYLETLEDFLARGLRLVNGDKYTGRDGNVVNVKTYNLSTVNTPWFGDEKRYVVKAAAYNTETPEEKEAFDAMTDTAPQQVESLHGGSCDKNEWKNGDPCVFGAGDRSGIYVTYDAYNEGHVIYSGGEYHYVLDGNFRKPETPEQRKERESDELAKQIMIDLCGEDIFDKRDWNYHKKFTEAANQAFKLVDLGYRKE